MIEPANEFGNFRRRAVLRLGAFSLVAGGSALAFHSSSHPTSYETMQIPETLQIDNLTVYPYATSHSADAWPKVKDSLIAKMKSPRYILPEYFPPEYKTAPDMVDRIIDNEYGEANKLFDHVAEEGMIQEKEFIVMDPAYDKSFGAFRELLQLPESSALLYTLWPELQYLGTSHRDTGNTRRDFLKKFTLKSAQTALAAMILSGLASPMFIDEVDLSTHGNLVISPALLIERDYRRVLVAKRLHDLGQKLPTGSDGLLIYPEGHMIPILNYVRNNEVREARYDHYRQIAGVPLFKHFENTRAYTPKNGQWLPLAL